MSMPSFPEINPEITCDRALNMILASIAMEELALSHIMNAEGEKLQYVLGTLKTSCGKGHSVEEVLAVNKSITALLDSVSQNQILLKSKMDKAIEALSEVCPHRVNPPEPPCCLSKCSAVFKGSPNESVWRSGCKLPWDSGHTHGRCVCLDPYNCSKIKILSQGRFMVSFAVNVKAKACCDCGISISLQATSERRSPDIFTVHEFIPGTDTTITVSMSGIILEASKHNEPISVFLKLLSPDSLVVERAILNIVEI